MQAAFKGPEISIHALLAESDTPRCRQRLRGRRFLSTLSLRRATDTYIVMEATKVISIHALLAESDPYAKKFGFCDLISIHALLAESDCGRRVGLPVAGHFYPRSPCGERLP